MLKVNLQACMVVISCMVCIPLSSNKYIAINSLIKCFYSACGCMKSPFLYQHWNLKDRDIHIQESRHLSLLHYNYHQSISIPWMLCAKFNMLFVGNQEWLRDGKHLVHAPSKLCLEASVNGNEVWCIVLYALFTVFLKCIE